MQDLVLTLVFAMALLMFAVFPAVKIVDFIKTRRPLTAKMQNFLTLIFTILLALAGALFLKL